jgi:hypothetical protein
MLERCGSIDQSPIEEDEPCHAPGSLPIPERHLDRAPSESGEIDPRHRPSRTVMLFRDNATSRFLYHVIAAALQFSEKARFAATRASRNEDKAVHLPPRRDIELDGFV